MSPQQSIAHYRIASKLGEGGMGEVWRATDTKLNRDVAIKILPEAFARDPDRMARFTREAQVLASLNHPNIAAIYGVEDRALIMELVEGETLPLGIPLDTALDYARQIAEALEYAHERGIIHRDLKPANIKVTPEGRVKILDFGLAKAMSNEVVSGDAAASPTLTMGATVAGVIMGTAAYMSPEQARGKPVDRRADIWAFGCVLYEMLTGRPVFSGETTSDILAGVIKQEPDLSAVPVQLRGVVERCLRKDPRVRWRDIGDVRMALDEPPPQSMQPPSRRSVTPWIAATTMLALALAITGALLRRATRLVEYPLMRLSVDLGPDALLGNRIVATLSPDATRIVYPARGLNGEPQLAVRSLNQTQAVLLPGTESGADPFFSPDGLWIGFFAGGKMKKVAAQGGGVVSLCDAPTGRGASWGADGNILATLSSGAGYGLVRVPEAGGSPQILTRPGEHGEATHRWPQILPGGQAVLFTASTLPSNYSEANVDGLILKTGQIKIVQPGGHSGRYLADGYLVYLSQGKLFATRFDPDRLEVKGTPTPLLDDVAEGGISGNGQFDFSPAPAGHGTFVYMNGKGGVSGKGWPILWLDTRGKTEPLLAAPGQYMSLRLSPEGKRIASSISGSDLFVYDWARDTSTRLTVSPSGGMSNFRPVWTPDGSHIAFHTLSSGGSALRWVRADGAGEPQTLLGSKGQLRPYSFSPDGKLLAFSDANTDTSLGLWTLPLDTSDPEHPKPGKPQVFLQARFTLDEPAFSPDGRWIAYASSESGRSEIYVRPFPNREAAGRSQISSAGGRQPVWSRNGRELFYEGLDNRIMVAPYTVKGGVLLPDKSRRWSEVQLIDLTNVWNFDLAPDGKRFAVVPRMETMEEQKGSVRVTFLLNFLDELRRRLP
jgi:serine/threonine-protein kinase